MKHVVGLAHALREQLIGIQKIKVSNDGKATKAEVVYNYLTSNEFKQRIEVWVEYFVSRKTELDKERMYYNKKWEKEDKELQKVIENTARVYGELQGIIGQALPKIQQLELPEG